MLVVQQFGAWRFVLLLLLFTVVSLIYLPGLSGAFLLDDFANLKTLERVSGQDNLAELSSIIFTGQSGVARVLPLLSFGLQADAWPDHPEQFKFVNLAIHLINGALIYGCALRLTKLRGMGQAYSIALLTSGMWLLNPLQVSTVLYVVQRMNLMSAFFMLSGTLMYLRGRAQLREHPQRSLVWMTGGVLLGTVLAGLCKENGLLLPLIVLVIEFTFLNTVTSPLLFKHWRLIFLIFPVILMAAMLVQKFSWLNAGFSNREFSMEERLITEAGILLEYAKLIVLPSLRGLGLFHDDHLVVHTFSMSAMLAILAQVMLVILAFLQRGKFPALFFGLAWFYVAHLLESTILPLELYFEHRNYLPMFGILFAVSSVCVDAYQNEKLQNIRIGLVAAGVAWAGIMIWTTSSEVRLWGDPFRQAVVWANEHPQSSRSQMHLAQILATSNQPERASEVFHEFVANSGHSEGYAVWMSYACIDDRITMPDLPNVRLAFLTLRFSYLPISGLEAIVEERERGECLYFRLDELLGMFDALLVNPNYKLQQSALYVLRGRLLAVSGHTDAAVESFDQALSTTPDVEIALLQVKAYVAVKRYGEAERKLEAATAINRRNGISRLGYERDIARWKNAISQEAANGV
jgi:tetratricopeptide (TPR) repeat protein